MILPHRAAVTAAAIGLSRRFVAIQQFCCFRSNADIQRAAFYRTGFMSTRLAGAREGCRPLQSLDAVRVSTSIGATEIHATPISFARASSVQLAKYGIATNDCLLHTPVFTLEH